MHNNSILQSLPSIGVGTSTPRVETTHLGSDHGNKSLGFHNLKKFEELVTNCNYLYLIHTIYFTMYSKVNYRLY